MQQDLNSLPENIRTETLRGGGEEARRGREGSRGGVGRDVEREEKRREREGDTKRERIREKTSL